MGENTIFQNNTVPSSPQNQEVPPAKDEKAVHTLPIAGQSVPNIQGAPTPMWQKTPQQSSGRSFPIKNIFKGLLGLFFIILVGFLGAGFILPRFAQNEKEVVTISYWGLWEGENVIRTILADFEKENPTVKVAYVKQDNKQYRDRVVTRAQNGTGPDVFLFHNTWLPQMVSYLLPLPNDVISKDEFQKTFYPVVINDLIHKGAIYGIPSGMDTLSMFINTEIFQQAGLTPPANWQDFARTARMLTVKDEMGKIRTAGAAMGTFDNVTHASDIISLLLVQNGANIRNIPITKESAIDAFDFYVSFAREGEKVWDETLDPSLLAFSKGNLAMYFGYSWDIFAIKQLNPQLSFQVVSVPHLPGRNTTIASYWANGVSAKSKYQKEAMLLLKFLSKKETMQKLFSESAKTRLFGEPYAHRDLAKSLSDNSLVYPFVEQAKDAASSFFASDTFDDGLNSQMNAYLGNAVRAMLGNTSTETAVDTLANGVAQILRQYGGQ